MNQIDAVCVELLRKKMSEFKKKNRKNNNLFQTVVFNIESHSSVKEDTFFKAAQILRNEIASYKEWSFKGPLIVMQIQIK